MFCRLRGRESLTDLLNQSGANKALCRDAFGDWMLPVHTGKSSSKVHREWIRFGTAWFSQRDRSLSLLLEEGPPAQVILGLWGKEEPFDGSPTPLGGQTSLGASLLKGVSLASWRLGAFNQKIRLEAFSASNPIKDSVQEQAFKKQKQGRWCCRGGNL